MSITVALHNLTTSGWVLLALTCAVALSLVVRLVVGDRKEIDVHAIILGIMVIWVTWLLVP